VNQRSVGIEIDNLGFLCDSAAGAYPDVNYGDCVPSGGRNWEEYPDEQMECLAELVYDIVKRNNIPIDRSHIKGHSEIQAGKSDPGPLFNWNWLMNKLNEYDSCS
jgi:N-acetyl-anhydromuramyl-L-alanine amidase AmpD